MTLEKTKKTTTKIKKSQLQKQKQTQNVVVNVNAPVKKATRKRPIKKPPQLKPVMKTPFQSPIYMPPIASFNPPKQPDNTSILSDLLKIINKPVPKPEPNELEKPKPEEREPAPPSAPALSTSFGPPDILANTMRGIREGKIGKTTKPQSIFDAPNVFNIPRAPISLVSEIKIDPTNTRQTFINTPPFEAPKEPFKFRAPLTAEPKPPTLVQTMNIGQEKKFEPQTNQPWSELETGGHFGLPKTEVASPLVQKVIKEARPTSEEIDLGIVPTEAGEIVQEDRVKNDEPVINLQPLTMGASATFNKAIIQPSSRAEEEPELQGTDELRGIERLPFASDAETARDIQEFLNWSKLQPHTATLLAPIKEPTLAEKLNIPVAESTYASPEAPEALAELLAAQAEGSKTGREALREAGFRTAPEAYLAIQKWNLTQPPANKINKSNSKTIATMLQELATTPLNDFKGLYDFYTSGPDELTHIPIPKKVKAAKHLSEANIGGSKI